MKIVAQTVARARASQGGFTLAEQLIGLLITGITFVTLFASISSGFAIVQLARENLRATQILQEKVETLRLYTMEQIQTAGFIPTSFSEAFYPNGNTNGVTYYGTLTLTNVPFAATYSSNLLMATFELTWTSGEVPRTRSTTTLVTRNGLQNYIY
jgi:type II secretory pathway pseudopilin PulG